MMVCSLHVDVKKQMPWCGSTVERQSLFKNFFTGMDLVVVVGKGNIKLHIKSGAHQSSA